MNGVSCCDSFALAVYNKTKEACAIYIAIMAIVCAILFFCELPDVAKYAIGGSVVVIHLAVGIPLFIKVRDIDLLFHDSASVTRREQSKAFDNKYANAMRANSQIEKLMGEKDTYPIIEVGNRDVKNLIFTTEDMTAPIMEGSFSEPLRKHGDGHTLCFYVIRYKEKASGNLYMMTLYQHQLVDGYKSAEWYLIGETNPCFKKNGPIAVTGTDFVEGQEMLSNLLKNEDPLFEIA